MGELHSSSCVEIQEAKPQSICISYGLMRPQEEEEEEAED
jgi:hypothetical protein